MSPDPNAAFCRSLLNLMHADVRKAFPQIKNIIAACGVTQTTSSGVNKQWFVEIDVPGLPRFAHDCRAYNATEARYKAWSAFMAKHAPAEFYDGVVERHTQRRGAA